MVGCCGFLSFSLVFCLLGGRLGTTLYIHFIRNWVETRRRSSASRESGRGRKDGKGAPFFAVGLGGFAGLGVRRLGIGLSTGRARPADHLSVPHVLGQPPLAQHIHRLSDCGPPPGVCAWRGWGDDAFYDLHCAYLGEEV